MDTFWTRAAQAGWTVNTSKRSSWTKKEKEIDVKLASNATKTACLNPGCTIVLVSGDGDFTSVVEDCTAPDMDVEVELWTWRHSLSNRLRDLEQSIQAMHDWPNFSIR